MSLDFEDNKQDIRAYRCMSCGALCVQEDEEDPELDRWYARATNLHEDDEE